MNEINGIATLAILIQSIVLSIFLINWLIYRIYNLTIKNVHFFQWIVDYMKNRKEFQYWKEEQTLKKDGEQDE